MCDYSLEMYKSVPAKAGDEITLRMFQSSSKGFVPAKDADKPTAQLMCAVCCEAGVEMTVEIDGVELDARFTREFQVGSPHRDGISIPSKAIPFISLQSLPNGMRATVTKELPIELLNALRVPEETPERVCETVG